MITVSIDQIRLDQKHFDCGFKINPAKVVFNTLDYYLATLPINRETTFAFRKMYYDFSNLPKQNL